MCFDESEAFVPDLDDGVDIPEANWIGIADDSEANSEADSEDAYYIYPANAAAASVSYGAEIEEIINDSITDAAMSDTTGSESEAFVYKDCEMSLLIGMAYQAYKLRYCPSKPITKKPLVLHSGNNNVRKAKFISDYVIRER